MPDPRRDDYWFPAKRYGWGWGMPRSWQGWTVIAAYGALVAVSVAMPSVAWKISVVVVATLGLVLICLKKGEPARWRWGGDS